MHNFRTYNLAVQFYRNNSGIKLPSHLRDQFLRASSSIALNLAEGQAKPTAADKRKFYSISLGSAQECEAILELHGAACGELGVLQAHLRNLIRATR